MVMVVIACTAIHGQASACDIEIETRSAELRDLGEDEAALPAAVDELLARDPGDLGAHHLRLELAVAKPSQLVDSALWLIDACPDLLLFDGPIAARVRDRRIDKAWQRAEVVAPSARVQRSAARYRYALERPPGAVLGTALGRPLPRLELALVIGRMEALRQAQSSQSLQSPLVRRRAREARDAALGLVQFLDRKRNPQTGRWLYRSYLAQYLVFAAQAAHLAGQARLAERLATEVLLEPDLYYFEGEARALLAQMASDRGQRALAVARGGGLTASYLWPTASDFAEAWRIQELWDGGQEMDEREDPWQ